MATTTALVEVPVPRRLEVKRQDKCTTRQKQLATNAFKFQS